MALIEFEAEKRESFGKKLKKIRLSGKIPAIIYGKKLAPLPVIVDQKLFTKTILGSAAGKNAIISLKVSGKKPVAVITSEIQRDPLTDEIIHIDFANVIMDEAIKAKVPLELSGLPIGVKESNGVLVHGLREIEVECLPGDIPEKYEIDVSQLEINDSLHVSDLPQKPKVKILSNSSEMIANCSPPTKEEVAPAPIPTPGEVPSVEGAPEVAEEQVKEKSAPGAPPPKAAAPAAKEAAPAAKPEKK